MIIYSKLEKSLNILFVFVSWEVSKLDKFKEVNDEQETNISFISITFEVTNFDKFNEVNDGQ